MQVLSGPRARHLPSGQRPHPRCARADWGYRAVQQVLVSWHCRSCGAGEGVHRGEPPAEHVCKPDDVARWQTYRALVADYHASPQYLLLVGQLPIGGLG